MTAHLKRIWSRLLADYGMVPVLLLLCLFFSVVTYTEQHPTGEAAAEQLAELIQDQYPQDARVLIASSTSGDDTAFVDGLDTRLQAAGYPVAATVKGGPPEARQALQQIVASGQTLDLIACNLSSARWLVFTGLDAQSPLLANARVVQPRSYMWPNFLKADNLLNITNQIAVIAIVAIGMTMVIITAGIDLSVGSLIAFSAVLSGTLIVEVAGALDATALGMTLACLSAILACAAIGLFTGSMVTLFRIPPFIATLAMMLVASGIAYIVARGQSVYQIPESFIWLGRNADLFGIPNSVLLMILLYIAAHVLMTRTRLGRYIYAIGGNVEAARLSGVPVRRVLLFTYACSGLLAGLGGVIMASQLKSGSPTYGLMYELYVIAAVVVGGTSLAGGEGRMLGTLNGAFIIAVIQNGMNLKDVEPYTQKVVLGAVILLAVMIDNVKKGGTVLDFLFHKRSKS